MRDWRGIRAEIGDRVFYVTADGVPKPRLHEAWVEEVGESHIRVRPTASPFGEMIGNWPVVTNPAPGIGLRAQPLG